MAIRIPVVVQDLAERASKTWLWAFAAAVPITSWAQGFAHVPWALGASIATGATLASLVGNTVSIPLGGNGLASLVPAIVKLFTPAAGSTSLGSSATPAK